jgi:hypothetical protein
VKSGKNASDTCTVLSEAYRREVMKKSSVFEWHKQFKEGREKVEDERTGRTRSHRTTENVEKARDVVHSERKPNFFFFLEMLRFSSA